jgi:Transposase DDE domain
MESQNTTKVFQILFGEDANQIAQEVGLIQRQRNLTGVQFAKTMILGLLENPDASRTELASLATSMGQTMMPQSLDERLQSEQAVIFFKTLLDKVLGLAWLPYKAPLPDSLAFFHDIILTDASIITLPDVLQETFPSGKNLVAQKAAVKLTLRYSFATKQIALTLTPAQLHDQKVAWLPQEILPNQLFLMDLGYFKLASFERISRADAFYISRYKTGTCLYNEEGDKIDLLPYLKQNNSFDIAVEVGADKRMKARLIGYKVSQEKGNERRRILKRKCQSRGTQPSAESLWLCDYTLLLSNIPVSAFSGEAVLNLARVRWQIELVFKCWKSHLNKINDWRSCNTQVILCLLYSKLLGCLCQQWLYLEASWGRWNQSLFKSVKSLQHFIGELINCVTDIVAYEILLTKIKRSLSICTVAKRKKRATFQPFE